MANSTILLLASEVVIRKVIGLKPWICLKPFIKA